MATAAKPGNAGLIRAVGRWSVVALVLNSIIGSGVFGVPSLVARTLGAAGPLANLAAVLIAAAGIGVIMACFAEVASRFTQAGGPYLYARTAFGRFVGIEMGWLAWLVRVTSAAANANLFVLYLAEFWPGAKGRVATVLVLTLLLGIFAAVNYRGVRLGAMVSNVFIVAKLVPLAVFAVAGGLFLLLHGAARLPATHVGSGGWLEALLILTFLFGGFEAGLMPMGEARNPRRDAPFALFTALVICTVVFSAIQVVVVGILPNAAQTDRPLAAAARVFLGEAGAVLMTVGALLSVYGWLSGMTLNAPRLTFALAERGDFPAFFAAVHRRFRTPHVSVLVFALLVWALAAWGNFAWNVVLSSVARLMTYGLVCASLPVLRRRTGGEAMFRLPAGTAFAAIGVAFAVVLASRLRMSELYVLATTVALAFVNWLWAAKTRHGDTQAPVTE